jgi:hypothetical protein
MFAPSVYPEPKTQPCEVFMDENPWMVAISDMELYREHKIIGSTDKVTKLQVPDLRKVLYIDVNASLNGNKLNFELSVNGQKSILDAGFGQRAMLGSNGNKRIAIPFPAETTAAELKSTGKLKICVNKKLESSATIHSLKAFILDAGFKPQANPVFQLDHDVFIDSMECVDPFEAPQH